MADRIAAALPGAAHATAPAAPAPSPVAEGAPRRGLAATLRLPGYGWMWSAGALWHTSRWSMAFLAAYLARTLSESPRLVQLTGVAMWLPLLLGGVAGGVVSDRFDRRRTLVWQLATLIPVVFGAGALALTDTLRLWMVYPLMGVLGVGWILDMTSRRALIYDLVGPARIDQAMALESFALGTGMTLGTLFGGSAVDALGVGRAFVAVGVMLVVSLLLFLRVPAVAAAARSTVDGAPVSPLAQLRDGWGLTRHQPGLVSILGITASVNFFYFSYTPLVQVIGRELGVGAGLTGLLAATAGMGMMVSAVAIARGTVRRRGRVYCAGALGAMALLVAAAQARSYALVFVALLAAGTASGVFGALQASLVMASVPAEARGRALGLLSTAIGVLPLGMLALGEVAEALGARTAVTASALGGLAVIAAWLARRPHVLGMTSDPTG